MYIKILNSLGDPCTHFLYGIVYPQQHKSRDSNQSLSDGLFFRELMDISTQENPSILMGTIL